MARPPLICRVHFALAISLGVLNAGAGAPLAARTAAGMPVESTSAEVEDCEAAVFWLIRPSGGEIEASEVRSAHSVAFCDRGAICVRSMLRGLGYEFEVTKLSPYALYRRNQAAVLVFHGADWTQHVEVYQGGDDEVAEFASGDWSVESPIKLRALSELGDEWDGEAVYLLAGPAESIASGWPVLMMIPINVILGWVIGRYCVRTRGLPA